MKKQQFEEFVTLLYIIIFLLAYQADLIYMSWLFGILAILNLIYQFKLAYKSALKRKRKLITQSEAENDK